MTTCHLVRRLLICLLLYIHKIANTKHIIILYIDKWKKGLSYMILHKSWKTYLERNDRNSPIVYNTTLTTRFIWIFEGSVIHHYSIYTGTYLKSHLVFVESSKNTPQFYISIAKIYHLPLTLWNSPQNRTLDHRRSASQLNS